MTYLPRDHADEAATKGDIDQFEDRFDRIEDRFDRLEDRFDRLEDRFDHLHDVVREQQRFYVGVTVGSMTALTAIFSLVVGLTR
jgi:hypothetical protein